MTKSDLEFIDDVLRTYRFMMASAVSQKFGNLKDINKHMAEAARVQDRISAELKSINNIETDTQSAAKAGEEFAEHWASYRVAQRSMLGSVLKYIECSGQQSLAERIKEKFGGDCKD